MKKFYFLTLALICAFVANAASVTYTVTVPTGTNACYIVGEMTGWGFTAMTKVNDTQYTITIANATTSQKYKYCSGPGWGYVEKDAKGNEIGDRTYSANDVVANWASVYNYPEKIYILGNNVEGNNWSTSKGPEMSHQEDGVYTISGVTINGADGGQYGYFSFAEKVGANWDAVNAGTRWGPNAENKQIVLGTADTGLTNTWAGGTKSWKIEPGVYDMMLNTNKLTLLVNQSVVATPEISIDGDDMISITCATEGATIYYTIDGTTPTTSSTEYTGDFKLTVDSLTVKAIAVKDGWKNSNVASEALVPTAIEEVGVDAGEAVYYNLQGVKVANPENGIFIKKQGGRTSKVVL